WRSLLTVDGASHGPVDLGLLAGRVGEDVRRPESQVSPPEVEQSLDEDAVTLPGGGQAGVAGAVHVDRDEPAAGVARVGDRDVDAVLAGTDVRPDDEAG